MTTPNKNERVCDTSTVLKNTRIVTYAKEGKRCRVYILAELPAAKSIEHLKFRMEHAEGMRLLRKIKAATIKALKEHDE